MTLNHNPRVTAERRLRINRGRLNDVCAQYRKWLIEYEKGVAARMYWTGITYAQLDKAAIIPNTRS